MLQPVASSSPQSPATLRKSKQDKITLLLCTALRATSILQKIWRQILKIDFKMCLLSHFGPWTFGILFLTLCCILVSTKIFTVFSVIIVILVLFAILFSFKIKTSHFVFLKKQQISQPFTVFKIRKQSFALFHKNFARSEFCRTSYLFCSWTETFLNTILI